jgi:dTDP-4-amino-4,6-dideoxygalactose transaminase
VHVPVELDDGHVYHLFPVRSPERAALQSRLRAEGIETLIHYPMTMPQQPAFAATDPADCPRAARAAGEVLSLPLYPGLSVESVRRVAAAVQAAR